METADTLRAVDSLGVAFGSTHTPTAAPRNTRALSSTFQAAPLKTSRSCATPPHSARHSFFASALRKSSSLSWLALMLLSPFLPKSGVRGKCHPLEGVLVLLAIMIFAALFTTLAIFCS